MVGQRAAQLQPRVVNLPAVPRPSASVSIRQQRQQH